MRFFFKLLDFYINSSFHVALSVVSLCFITINTLQIQHDINLLFFVFFASITGYNFVKYFGLAKFHHRSLATWLKWIQIFSAICFAGMVYFTFQLRRETIIFLGILGLITFLYAIPLAPRKWFLDNKKNLRSISGLKVYLIALVWSGVTVFLPLFNAEVLMSTDVVILGIQRFLLVLLLMLPFEIRDLNYDSVKLATIPQQIGISKTKILGFIIAAIYLLLCEFYQNIGGKEIIWRATVILISLAFLGFSNTRSSKYYTSLWVESIPIFWAVMLLLF